MIKSIATSIITPLLKAKYKLFKRSESVDIIQKLADAKRILIYMPDDIEQFGAALKSLERLRELQPNWELTIITKIETVNLIDDKRLRLKILPYSSLDVNIFGLPKPSLKASIATIRFDLALDFKLKMDVLSVLLFQVCGAPVKVALDMQEKSLFYNLAIRVNPAETLHNKYGAMVKYINIMANARREGELQYS
jgi:hypothetical protein